MSRPCTGGRFPSVFRASPMSALSKNSQPEVILVPGDTLRGHVLWPRSVHGS